MLRPTGAQDIGELRRIALLDSSNPTSAKSLTLRLDETMGADLTDCSAYNESTL
jgi:hypothetical protein